MEMDVSLVLELQRLSEQLAQIDLTKLEEEKERRKTKIEKLSEDAALGRKLERRFGEKRGPGRPKLHWKTRMARRKATKKKYYDQKWKPRRQKELAEELKTVEGWYAHITRLWKGERFSFEEWETELWPLLKGRVPTFKRDDTSLGWTLDNVCMYESGTRNLIYSPETLKLRDLGMYT